jgi:hypothetical protein
MAKTNELSELKETIAALKKENKTLKSEGGKKSKGGILLQQTDQDKRGTNNYVHFDAPDPNADPRYSVKQGKENAHQFTELEALNFMKKNDLHDFNLVHA